MGPETTRLNLRTPFGSASRRRRLPSGQRAGQFGPRNDGGQFVCQPAVRRQRAGLAVEGSPLSMGVITGFSQVPVTW